MTQARVLVAKVGLDAADRGASAIVRVLRDAGHEVVFSAAGLTPAMVGDECARERPDVLVVTMPAQAMPLLTPMVLRELDRNGVHVPVLIAGPVLDADVATLHSMGVTATLGAAPSAQQIRDVVSTALVAA